MNELYTLAAGAEFALAALTMCSLLLFSGEVSRRPRSRPLAEDLTTESLFLQESSHSTVSMLATNLAFATFIWRARESAPARHLPFEKVRDTLAQPPCTARSETRERRSACRRVQPPGALWIPIVCFHFLLCVVQGRDRYRVSLCFDECGEGNGGAVQVFAFEVAAARLSSGTRRVQWDRGQLKGQRLGGKTTRS